MPQAIEFDTQALNWKDFSLNDYYKSEKECLTPQLEALGFENIYFYNIEADSFGPLVRGITMERNGIKYKASYG